jgi:hypothetical protein
MRKLKLKKLPKGRFKYILQLKTGKSKKYSRANHTEAEQIIELLERSAKGLYSVQYDREDDWGLGFIDSQRVHKIYLTELCDAVTAKLCYSTFIKEIYEIVTD